MSKAILYGHGFIICFLFAGSLAKCALLEESARQTALKGSVITSS